MATLVQLVESVAVNQFELKPGTTTIGRHPDNDIVIDDVSVSGHHAKLSMLPNRYLDGAFEYFIEDLGSTNGTSLNGNQIKVRQLMVSQDVLSLAWTEFKLVDSASSPMEKTAYILQR